MAFIAGGGGSSATKKTWYQKVWDGEENPLPDARRTSSVLRVQGKSAEAFYVLVSPHITKAGQSGMLGRAWHGWRAVVNTRQALSRQPNLYQWTAEQLDVMSTALAKPPRWSGLRDVKQAALLVKAGTFVAGNNPTRTKRHTPLLLAMTDAHIAFANRDFDKVRALYKDAWFAALKLFNDGPTDEERKQLCRVFKSIGFGLCDVDRKVDGRFALHLALDLAKKENGSKAQYNQIVEGCARRGISLDDVK